MGRPYPPRTHHCRRREVNTPHLVCCLGEVRQGYWDMLPNLGGSSFAIPDRMFEISADPELATSLALLDPRFCLEIEPLPHVSCSARAHFV